MKLTVTRLLVSSAIILSVAALACSQQGGKEERAQPAEAPASVITATAGSDDGTQISRDGRGGWAAPLPVAEIPELSDKQRVALADLLDDLAAAEDQDDAYRIAESIEEMGRGAVPQLKDRAPKLDPKARIAAFRTLYNLSEWDTAVEGLIDLAEAEGERDDRVAAADMLSELASRRHQKALKDALRNVFDVEVKIELCMALWQTSKDTLAKQVLYDLLKSESETFQIKAALALGRLGDLTKADDILEALAAEPSDRGRIAALALQREDLLQKFARLMQSSPRDASGVIKIETNILDTVAEMIGERYIYEDRAQPRRLMMAAARGMLQGLDPYTTYLDETQMRRAADVREFRVPSLGISLGAKAISDRSSFKLPTIISVTPGSPAARAGLRPGDQIRNIAPHVTSERISDWRRGVPPDDTETKGEEMIIARFGDQVSMLYGPMGSSTGLLVFREDWILPQWMRLVHETPQQDRVRDQILPGGLSYIRIGSLNADAPSDFKAALERAKAADAQGLLLDLRDTSNGSIEATMQIASMLLPADLLVTWTQGRSADFGKRKDFETSGDFRETDMLVTVLINGGTADCSEVLAAALQDYDRATLAGSTTFGRAIVQQMMTFEALVPKRENPDESEVVNHALLMTVSYYHTGKTERRIFGAGVAPDVIGTPQAFEGWVYEELDTLRDGGDFKTYIEDLLENHTDKALELARGDGGEPSAYPGFAEFREGHDNHLSDEHVRWALRRKLRMRLIQSGQLKDVADLQEDQEFVAGLRELAERARVDLSEFDAYKWVSAE